MQSSCVFSRPFVSSGAFTILSGSSLTFIAGFNKWANQTTGNALNSSAYGVSPAIIWPVVDSAVALGLATVSAAFLALYI